MKPLNGYEAVIGLEVHIELKTNTKIFCGCSTAFGAAPNTQCCPICMGFPGTMPILNKKVVEIAVKAGLATNCNIAHFSKLDRKNYFYPDLPKAYQISQFDVPLCRDGHLDIEIDGGVKRIGITRIHIEEDAGKLIHDDTLGTLIDCNRCGVPLIEIVSEPDISSAEQAVAYVKKLRAVMMYTGVSDCKMNEGSLRCDVNLSVRKVGEKSFGTRTEIKNLNSFTFIQKAIEYEYERQVKAIEAGESIVQETRRFDESSEKTFSMRQKENFNDYRFFPEPDVPPFSISDSDIERLRSAIPMLSDERKRIYIENYDITPYDAEMLTAEKFISDYFEQAVVGCKSAKLLANIMITDLLKTVDADAQAFPIGIEMLRQIVDMAADSEINSSTAKKVLKYYCENTDAEDSPCEYVRSNKLGQINDVEMLSEIIRGVVESSPKAAQDYKAGKSAAVKSLMGMVMGKTQGRANPVIADMILSDILKDL